MSISEDATVVALSLAISLAAVVGVLEQALLNSATGWVYLPMLAGMGVIVLRMIDETATEDVPTADREADA